MARRNVQFGAFVVKSPNAETPSQVMPGVFLVAWTASSAMSGRTLDFHHDWTAI